MRTIIRFLVSTLLLMSISIIGVGVAYAYDEDDDGDIEVGGVYNEDYYNNILYDDVDIAEQTTTDFIDTLVDASWQENFNYADVDDEAPFENNSDSGADGVDIFWYTGHGGPGHITLVNDWWPLPNVVSYDEVNWGDSDLEWVMLYACETLQNDHGPTNNYIKSNGEFAQSLNGVHVICGAYTSMEGTNPNGGYYVAYLLVNGYDIDAAWFTGCDLTQSSSVTLMTIFEHGGYLSDHIWGEGTVYDYDVDGSYGSNDYTCS